jgi:hypothetical protein
VLILSQKHIYIQHETEPGKPFKHPFFYFTKNSLPAIPYFLDKIQNFCLINEYRYVKSPLLLLGHTETDHKVKANNLK